MPSSPSALALLCIGHASYDQIMCVDHHPDADEKIVADQLLNCGGGPAANAAVMAAKLGFSAGFCGYLGNDHFGNSHFAELQANGINTQLIVRGTNPTPLSVVLVKPNGDRALINHKGNTSPLSATSVNFAALAPQVLLFDGHEPALSLAALKHYSSRQIDTVLDAGSVHEGTTNLLDRVNYLVCSEKFACQYAGTPDQALPKLAEKAPVVIITLGEQGLIWRRGLEQGQFPAPSIIAIDSTGAGDAFHGAFAAGLSAGLDWENLLAFASVAGALCCSGLGARTSLPNKAQHQELLKTWLATLQA